MGVLEESTSVLAGYGTLELSCGYEQDFKKKSSWYKDMHLDFQSKFLCTVAYAFMIFFGLLSIGQL
jgi:hypothetical protein